MKTWLKHFLSGLVLLSMLAFPQTTLTASVTGSQWHSLDRKQVHSSALWYGGHGRLSGITVNTFDDELNSDGDCSLREAVEAARMNAGVDACLAGETPPVLDTIVFSSPGTLTLESQLEISTGGAVLIDGGKLVSISGGNSTRILNILEDGNLTLDGLSLTNGSSNDGGGGIYNSGTLTMTESTLTHSSSWSYNYGGGGITNVGELAVISSTISSNMAWYTSGGGIVNNNLLKVRNSLLTGNSAHHVGGGITNNGTAVIDTSNISGNSVFYDGGGLYNNGPMTVTNTTISLNSALYGGGIYNSLGQLILENSTVSGNQSSNDGGGISNGGALNLSNVTISNNHTGGFGGGVRGGNVSLQNSIIANNTADVDGDDCYFIMSTSGGYNLTGSECIYPLGPGDQIGIDPVLGPLEDNGGPTLTQALLAGSPAIDAGNPDGCMNHLGNLLPNDQRGYLRYGRCDTGSYEWQLPPVLDQWVYLPCISRTCTPIFTDDYSDPSSGWPELEYAEFKMGYLNNQYQIAVKAIDYWAGARPGVSASDYFIVVDVKNETGTYGTYGLMFGVSEDWTEFYTFEIDTNGYYWITRYNYSSQEWEILANGFSSSIKTGTATNQLKILRDGVQISAYANGMLLNLVEDAQYTGSRYGGLIGVSYDEAPVDVRFDNFGLYPLVCGTGRSTRTGLEQLQLNNAESQPHDREPSKK